jgi:hypothetical protein
MVIQILESLGLDKNAFIELDKLNEIKLTQSNIPLDIQAQILGIYTE